jgi:hypothetical protein
MREDCRYFQRRTYRSGDSVQFCALRLAPEAPWRCPDSCPRYTPTPVVPGRHPQAAAERADGSDRGPGVAPGRSGSAEAETGPPPARSGFGHAEAVPPGAAAVLSSAEGIIGAAGPEIRAERTRARREEEQAGLSLWERLRRRSARWRR